MRINKFFTEQGYCSRREADKLIQSGRVKINKKLAVLGDKVKPDDKVYVDNKEVSFNPPLTYIMYNKPLGVTSTTDSRIEGNIIAAVNHPLRVFPIGRLDKYSSGLILLTNDGDIVNDILRSHFGHEKEYEVEVNQPVEPHFLEALANGVDIDGYVTKKCSVKKIATNRFSIILTEGKNRQIRRMCEALGAVVKSLHRVRIMNIKLGRLKSGEWVDIPPVLLKDLKNLIARSKENDSKITK